MLQLKAREYRMLSDVAVQKEGNSYIVEGYCMTWDRYLLFDFDGNQIYERFERDCFVGCDMSDIIMQYDHQGKVYARTSNNTLQITVDDKGLYIKADLSKSQASREMYEEISSGLVTKMSWGFATKDYYFDESTSTIVHKSIKKIYDVSAVSIPANDGTSIHARSELLEEQIARITKELEEKQQQLLQQRNKIKLQLKLKLGGF